MTSKHCHILESLSEFLHLERRTAGSGAGSLETHVVCIATPGGQSRSPSVEHTAHFVMQPNRLRVLVGQRLSFFFWYVLQCLCDQADQLTTLVVVARLPCFHERACRDAFSHPAYAHTHSEAQTHTHLGAYVYLCMGGTHAGCQGMCFTVDHRHSSSKRRLGRSLWQVPNQHMHAICKLSVLPACTTAKSIKQSCWEQPNVC